jgi:sarcosine/dimethylglycine N-methyltransferase
MARNYEETATVTAQSYYNSSDADTFYYTIWGGEDIHIGLYENSDEDIGTASRRTVAQMAEYADLSADSVVLDIGSGYGGAARYLADRYGCRVVALNLSEVENKRAREQNRKAGLEDKIEVVDGSFEDIPFEDNSFDLIWSQDAMLHSGRREQVLNEAARVLKPGGRMVFTDPMRADDCDAEELGPILARLNLSDLACPSFYRETLGRLGFEELGFDENTRQLATHYQRVHDETVARDAELSKVVGRDYIERMKTGLRHWVEGGKKGRLAWGIFRFRKAS